VTIITTKVIYILDLRLLIPRLVSLNFSCWEVQYYVILVHYWNIDNAGNQV